MYPYLRSRVVIVEGPNAHGLYDLNEGVFHRINRRAGYLLSALDGLRQVDEFAAGDRSFLNECHAAGFLEWQDRPLLQQATPLSAVIRRLRPVRFAWIELTSKCNQLCKHCFLGSDLNAHPPYSKHEVFEMLEVLDRAGARQIILSGGEPLSHPDFWEILHYAGSRFLFRLALLTNGSHRKLLDGIPELLEHDVTVKIPLLGWGDSHNAMAGIENGFSRTVSAIEKLLAAGVNVELGTTVTGLNYRDIPKVREYANALGIKMEVSPLYAVGFARDNRKDLYSISQEEIIRVCQEDKKNAAQPCRPRRMAPASRKARYAADPTDYDAVNLKDYLTAHSECGQKIVAILSNREVTPCLMLRDKRFSLGSLAHDTLSAILTRESGRAAEFDELMKLESIPGCRDCEARFVCKAGGCPASAHAFAGSVQVKNPLFRDCYYFNDQTRMEVGLEPLPQA